MPSWIPNWLRHPSNPLSSLEIGGQRISKETYLMILSIAATLCGAVHGFMITQSQLMITNRTFLQKFEVESDNAFALQYLTIFYLGEFTGALLSYLVADPFGRKNTIVACSVICILMLIWSVATTSATNLLISRFFVAITLGLQLSTSPIYVTEVSTTVDRGRNVGFLYVSMLCGSFLALVFYFFIQLNGVSPRVRRACVFVPPFLLLTTQAIMLYVSPHSPRWLLAQKTPAESIQAMKELRSGEITREFNGMYRALTKDARLGDGWWDILQSKSVRLRLMLSVFLKLMQQLVGIQLLALIGHILLVQLQHQQGSWVDSKTDINRSNTVDYVNPFIMFLGFLLIFLFSMAGSALESLNGDKLGRKFFLILGCFGMSVSWLAAAICMYVIDGKRQFYRENTEVSSSSSWFLTGMAEFRDSEFQYSGMMGSVGEEREHRVSGSRRQHAYYAELLFVISLCLFSFFFSASLGPIAWIYPAEIFPYRARAKASSVTTACHFLFTVGGFQLFSIWLYDFPRNSKSATPESLLLFLALFSFMSGLITFCLFPETKKLKFFQMEELFRVEQSNSCCGCCPPADSRTPLLGLKTLVESHRTLHKSFSNSSAASDREIQKINEIKTLEDEENEEYETGELPFEASFLHKYSSVMRESQFEFYNGEEQPLITSYGFNYT